MPTVTFLLNCCAILGMIDATALSLQASPLGYNASSKNILTAAGAISGHEVSSISFNASPTALGAYNSTSNNETVVINASSLSACCFVVQDTIDARYWADYLTYTTYASNNITSLITFATEYIDTTVTGNISTVVRILSHNTTVTTALNTPGIPYTYNDALGPSVTQIALNGSLVTTFGATITSPTQVYVFQSVNIINVPAVSDNYGRPVCATTSRFRATCPAQTYARQDLFADNHIQAATTQSTLLITGINSNAERYFSNPSPKQGSEMIPVNLDVIQVSLSKPFVYTPLGDQFPSNVVNENLGYVPQALIDWIAQNSEYASKIPGIASCLPGGPSLDFFDYFCFPAPSMGGSFLQFQLREPDLTVSSTVTVAGKGCFHPGACPTPATPGATAVAGTPEVTPEAERLGKAGASSAAQAQDTSSPNRFEKPSTPQAPSQPLPAPAETPASTPVTFPEKQAVNLPPSPLSNAPSPSPPGAFNQIPSARTDSSENPLAKSPENSDEAKPPSNNPAKPPSHFQGLGAIIASAIGITPTPPPNSQKSQPSPGPTPTLSYSISIAPSASAVVINGVTSILPARGPEGGLGAGTMLIAVGSHQISQNAASEYVIGGQTLAPGAPPVDVQGTEVSLAPSASAIVIAGSTIILSATSAPAFTVRAQVVTANSASQYVAGGQTLTPGGPAVTISGTRISLAPSATQVVVGSSTIGLTPTFTPPPLPPLTLGSQTYTANSNSEYTIAGQILKPGGPAVTVLGTRLSLAPSATQVVVGSNTIRLGPAFTPLPLTFGSQTFTANSVSNYIIDGQTLIPGAPAITISGTPISLAPAATQVVMGSSTIRLGPASTPLLTFGSQIFTANSLSDYIIDDQTLVPGAPAITISNTPISLAPDASKVVIGSSTETLHSNPTLPPLIIGSQTFTANNAGAYVIGTQTLTPGAPGIVVPGSLLAPAPSLSVFTVAGQIFTANPTGFSIDGTTISAGGPGVVISGTPVSLQASGVLHVGNSSVVLASATVADGHGVAAFAGGGDRVGLRLLYAVLGSVVSLVIVAAV